jgi:phenylalanine-4-hydroxylase
VIPVHLNELAPPAVGAVFPGVAYQPGNLLASRNSVFQTGIAAHFWFPVEFGVIHERGAIKVYGSGLVSSHGECTHVVESFDQIYEAAKEAESRLG